VILLSILFLSYLNLILS